MAIIEIYASKVNQMSDLIQDEKKASMDDKTELRSLWKKAVKIDKSVCHMDEVLDEIKASCDRQDHFIGELETLDQNVNQFISKVVQTDRRVADLIRKRKNEFYAKYRHLRPDGEHKGWHQMKADLKSAGEWCRDHWKEMVAGALVVATVGVLIFLPGATVLLSLAKGVLIGASLGGLIGGAVKMIRGGVSEWLIYGCNLRADQWRHDSFLYRWCHNCITDTKSNVIIQLRHRCRHIINHRFRD